MNRSGIGTPRIKILLLGLILSPGASSGQTSTEGVSADSHAGEEESESADSAPKLTLPLLSPKWLDTAPAIPRLGFEVGAFYSFDSQSSLGSSFSRTTTVVRDLNRGTASTTLDVGDPRLDDRKFDYELDVERSGVRVPIVFPRLAGAKVVSLTLGLEAGIADVGFDVLDRTEPELSTSFSGDGPTFGVGLDVATCVTAACKWITSTGYWFRYLPSLSVTRSLPADGGVESVADDATLRRQAHELSLRFGYSVATDKRRYAPYTGVIYRHTELEVEDVLTLRSQELGLETTLTSTAKFDSDAVLAVAGVEGQLSKKLSGRLESFFGEGDHGVRFQVGWSWWGEGDPEIAGKRNERKRRQREKRARRRFEKWEKRFASMVPSLLARIREIEKEYFDRWGSLEVVEASDGPAYRIGDVEALLADTEGDLVDALSSRKRRRHRDLTPLRDYVIFRYERTLELLASASLPASSARTAPPRAIVPAVSSVPAHSMAFAAQDTRKRRSVVTDFILKYFGDVFPFLRTAIEDEECRFVEVEFKRENNELLALTPFSADASPSPHWKRFEQEPLPVPRGIYGYRLYEDVWALQRDPPSHLKACPPKSITCPIDLIERPCSELTCPKPDDPLDSDLRYCKQAGSLAVEETRCVVGEITCN